MLFEMFALVCAPTFRFDLNFFFPVMLSIVCAQRYTLGVHLNSEQCLRTLCQSVYVFDDCTCFPITDILYLIMIALWSKDQKISTKQQPERKKKKKIWNITKIEQQKNRLANDPQHLKRIKEKRWMEWMFCGEKMNFPSRPSLLVKYGSITGFYHHIINV